MALLLTGPVIASTLHLQGLEPLSSYQLRIEGTDQELSFESAMSDADGRLYVDLESHLGSSGRELRTGIHLELHLLRDGETVERFPFSWPLDEGPKATGLVLDASHTWRRGRTESLRTTRHPKEPGIHPIDASSGTVNLPTTTGVQTFDYHLSEGDVMILGDINLGPLDELERELSDKANAPSSLGRRWPAGIVPYEIAAELEWTETAARFLEAMKEIEASSPVRFRPRTDEEDYIRLKYSTQAGRSSSSWIGRKKGLQYILIWPTHGKGVIMHELGHALGFYHEHQRFDRNDFVAITAECSSLPANNFSHIEESKNLVTGPYDFDSIMHYSSNQGYRSGCGTYPILRIDGPCPTGRCVDNNGDGFAEFIKSNRSHLSGGDIDGLFRLHATARDRNEANDFFGVATAQGDFNGDGALDLAIGTPFEELYFFPDDSGLVTVFRGQSGAQFAGGQPAWPLPWTVLNPRRDALDSSYATDAFGFSLASGDFDGDGFDDLAIGAPRRDAGAATDVGALFVYRGSETGLQRWKTFDERAFNALRRSGELFGWSLSSGDFNGDGFDDLAVGAPGEKPGDSPPSGGVFFFRGGDSGLSKWYHISQQGLSAMFAGENFGFALASGDFNGDGLDDLVISDPDGRYNGENDGMLFLFRGTTDKLQVFQVRVFGGVAKRQGFALATGDMDGDGLDEVAIGAPESASSSGRVYVLRGRSSGILPLWKALSQTGVGNNEAGDRFGAALAMGNFDGQPGADLAVGVPDEKTGTGFTSGWVYLFHGTASGPTPWRGLNQAGIGVDENGDFFGFSLLAADFDADGNDDLLVGAPGETLDDQFGAGAAYLYRGGGETPIGWKRLDQQTHSPDASDELP